MFILAAQCTPEYFEETLQMLKSGKLDPGTNAFRDNVIFVLAVGMIGALEHMEEGTVTN